MSRSIVIYLTEGPLTYATNIAIPVLGVGAVTAMGNAVLDRPRFNVGRSMVGTGILSGALNIGELFNKEKPIVQKVSTTPSTNKKDVPKIKKQDIIKNV
jgi:hypothetical protein